MAALFAEIGRRWCRAMHQKPRWPIHGEYVCLCACVAAASFSNVSGYVPYLFLHPTAASRPAEFSKAGREGPGGVGCCFVRQRHRRSGSSQ